MANTFYESDKIRDKLAFKSSSALHKALWINHPEHMKALGAKKHPEVIV